MKKFQFAWVLFLLNVLNNISAFSQPSWVKQWDRSFGGIDNEYVVSFDQTKDSGFLISGYSNSAITGNKTSPSWGGSDFWMVKTDSIGNKLWEKYFGGSGTDVLAGITPTFDGGYILGGTSNSNVSGDVSDTIFGISDYWLIKIDSLGVKQWDKKYGGSANDVFGSLIQTKDSGYIFGGSTNSIGGGNKIPVNYGLDDYWIVKTDSLGAIQWQSNFGGSDYEEFSVIVETLDGGYLAGGTSYSGISGNKSDALIGLRDYWIVKMDSLGIKQWEKSYGGLNSNILTTINALNDGSYILGGESDGTAGGNKSQPTWGMHDAWIVKIDSSGNIIWDKDFGGVLNEEVNLITPTADNSFLVSCDSYSSISGDKSENNIGLEQTWVLKIDSLGNKQWDKTIFSGGHDEGGRAIRTYDGCYAVCNYTNSDSIGYKSINNFNNLLTTSDYWIIKFCDTALMVLAPNINLASSDTFFCEKQCIDFFDLSANNPTSWQWFFPGADSTSSTLQNPTNICYQVYGSFDVTLIACNSAGCDTLTYYGFINEYQNPTDSIWSSNDTLYSLPFPTYQWFEVTNGLIAGETNQYFIPTQPGSYYCVVGDTIGCISTSNIIAITSYAQLSFINCQLSVVPNPFNNQLNFSLINNHQSEITLFDIASRKLLQQSFTNSTSLNTSQLSSGVYFYEVKCRDSVIGKGKVVKE